MSEDSPCGADGTPEVLKRFITRPLPGVDMAPACRPHDRKYGTLGYGKFKADIEMLGDGIKYHPWNPIGWAVSFVEFLAVTIGGHGVYKKSQDEAKKEKEKLNA